MKNSKALTAVICIIAIVFSVLTGTYVYATEQVTDIPLTQLMNSDTYYSFDASTKTLTISGNGETPDYKNESGSDYTQPWYYWRSTSIDRVVVEEGITKLGTYMFKGVGAIDFSLPSTLVSISSFAFANCGNVEKIVIPEGVTTLDESSFYYCYQLKSVLIPSTVTSIGKSSFENCSNLSDVTFASDDMQLTIGSRTFLACKSLNKIIMPKEATMYSYSVGYNSTNKGGVVNTNMLMGVYENSAAQAYAEKNNINYYFVDNVLQLGKPIQKTYSSENQSSLMKFTFTPDDSEYYKFFSYGDVDVKCDSITQSGADVDADMVDDNSNFDPNFTATAYLEQGLTYTFTVSSEISNGTFEVYIYPRDIESIEFDFSPSVNANENDSGYFDVASKINGEPVILIYKTGFTQTIDFENGESSLYRKMTYSDNQNQGKWLCGTHTASIDVDGISKSFDVTINHSYKTEVFKPTISTDGYTLYKCVLGDDTYKSDYVIKTGIHIYGNAVLMETPDGSHPSNIPIAYIGIYVNGKRVGEVDENGNFSLYISGDVTQVMFRDNFSVDKFIDVENNSEHEVNLGTVAVNHFDLHKDGVINAKDYAIFRKLNKKYGDDEKRIYLPLDLNRDGIVDIKDWVYSSAFLAQANAS